MKNDLERSSMHSVLFLQKRFLQWENILLRRMKKSLIMMKWDSRDSFYNRTLTFSKSSICEERRAALRENIFWFLERRSCFWYSEISDVCISIQTDSVFQNSSIYSLSQVFSMRINLSRTFFASSGSSTQILRNSISGQDIGFIKEDIFSMFSLIWSISIGLIQSVKVSL